ncbi:hypothetical protein EJ04DRAFT_176921 [Polyplosphaeria fusca]|uniref:Uncharacterized protein n=1 Tax=Polyplosphaeria fusca TaxID=682080 RepID=A0A9P4V454_9PLEO|nr:hypothetical protein EJ04DRAFT_176921 [Polyplosphaeria fusca]
MCIRKQKLPWCSWLSRGSVYVLPLPKLLLTSTGLISSIYDLASSRAIPRPPVRVWQGASSFFFFFFKIFTRKDNAF